VRPEDHIDGLRPVFGTAVFGCGKPGGISPPAPDHRQADRSFPGECGERIIHLTVDDLTSGQEVGVAFQKVSQLPSMSSTVNSA
jgi:hypothetical protein